MGFKIGDKVLVEGVVEKIDEEGDLLVLSELAKGVTSGGGWVGPQATRSWTERPPEPVTEFWKQPGEPYRIMSDGSVQEGGGTDPDGSHGIKWVPAEEPQEVLCRYIHSLLGKR